jgi:uncharacterized protein (DUF697 family)
MEQEATGHATPEHTQPGQPTPEHATPEIGSDKRGELAMTAVKRAVAWSALGGMVPFPVLDVLAVGGVQIQLLRRLARIYDVPFSENIGKSVVASLMGSIFPASAAATTAAGTASALKSVPIVGTAVGTLVMPSLAAGATYIIGKVFMQHFASGGTLLDFNAPDYREFIREHTANLKSKM